MKRAHSGAKECLTQPHLRERVNVFPMTCDVSCQNAMVEFCLFI